MIFHFFRAYAAATSQFLAPFESSIKTRGSDSPVTVEHDDTNRLVTSIGNSASTIELSHSAIQDSRSLSADIADWNPFEEVPFMNMSEDHIFGAEFDKIRESSTSSEYYHWNSMHL